MCVRISNKVRREGQWSISRNRASSSAWASKGDGVHRTDVSDAQEPAFPAVAAGGIFAVHHVFQGPGRKQVRVM
jgi:hypothetical protein